MPQICVLHRMPSVCSVLVNKQITDCHILSCLAVLFITNFTKYARSLQYFSNYVFSYVVGQNSSIVSKPKHSVCS